MEQKLARYREEFKKRHNESNFTILLGDEINGRDFLAEAEAMPFLGEKRMIVVRNFLENGKEIEQKIVAEHIKDIPETTVLFFIEDKTPDRRTQCFKTLNAYAMTEIFNTPSLETLPGWIQKEAQKRNAKIGNKEALYLASAIGGNLWHLAHAVEKLSLYAKKRAITIKDIDALVNANVTASIFRFTDALGERNARTALDTFQTLIKSGEDLMRIFYMIVRHVRLLIQVKEGLAKKMAAAHLARELRQPPFVIQNLTKQTKNFTRENLCAIYEKLLAIDIGVKTGKIRFLVSDNREFLLAIETWIAGYAALPRK